MCFVLSANTGFDKLALNLLSVSPPSTPSVHGQQTVVAKQFTSELLELPQTVVIEGSAGESELDGLLVEGGDDLGMAVALIHCGVGRQEVEIFLPLHVPDIQPFPAGQSHGQWLVVCGSVFCLFLKDLLRRETPTDPPLQLATPQPRGDNVHHRHVATGTSESN